MFALYRYCREGCGTRLWFTSEVTCAVCRERLSRRQAASVAALNRSIFNPAGKPSQPPPRVRSASHVPPRPLPPRPAPIAQRTVVVDDPFALPMGALAAAALLAGRSSDPAPTPNPFAGGGGDSGGAGASGTWDNPPGGGGIPREAQTVETPATYPTPEPTAPAYTAPETVCRSPDPAPSYSAPDPSPSPSYDSSPSYSSPSSDPSSF